MTDTRAKIHEIFRDQVVQAACARKRVGSSLRLVKITTHEEEIAA